MSKRGAVLAGKVWPYRFNLPDGTHPSIVLDFVNQKYFDGSNYSASLASLVSGGPTIDANGMLCNATTFNGIGALLTALQQPAITIRAETNLGTNGIVGAIVGLQATGPSYCPLFEDSTSGSQVGGWNGTAIHGFAPNWTQRVYSAAAWDAAGRAITAGGAAANTDNAQGTYPPATTVTLGSTWGTDAFGGYLRTLAIYPKRASATALQIIAAPLPFLPPAAFAPLSGAHCVLINGSNDYVTPGPKLIYERTQPWTCMAGIHMSVAPATAAVVFTNVTNTPWFGYELWVDPNGHLRVRIMGNWQGGGGMCAVAGSVNVIDGQWHTVAATYDGSSTPAGIKLYVDGVLDTSPITEENDLTSTIISGTPDFWVGNQLGSGFLIGPLDNFVMSNIVRSPAYIAANVGVLPAVDANTVLSYAFEEGSGTTTADGSANNFTGTLKNGATWL